MTTHKKRAYIILGVLALVIVTLVAWKLFRLSNQTKLEPTAVQVSEPGSDDGTIPVYEYTEAADHIGEKATVKGTVLKVFTAKSGVTFLDFCKDLSSCPFSAVIFSGDVEKFGDVSSYAREVSVTGVIRAYQSRAEMVLNDPEQVK